MRRPQRDAPQPHDPIDEIRDLMVNAESPSPLHRAVLWASFEAVYAELGRHQSLFSDDRYVDTDEGAKVANIYFCHECSVQVAEGESCPVAARMIQKMREVIRRHGL